ncbi:hypothetical protein AB0F59_13635 [Micromonospora lupini]|uniref:hypothetical protein n=1 Tax=Micromonospora lupini TaxID=285679 RepID=UPI0033D0ABC6
MSAPAVLVLGALLADQTAKVWQQGAGSLRYTYAPVFAVRFPPPVTVAGHLLALPLALLAELTVPPPARTLLVLGCAVFWLLCLQRRLANHAWIGFVALTAVTLSPARLAPVIGRDLLIGLYLSAVVFKLHRDYLTGPASAGRVVTALYLRLLGLRVPEWLLRTAPAAVVATELAVGVALLVPHGEPVGLALAILMHLGFGVSGNFGFSTVALALWAVALGGPTPADGVWWAVPVSTLLGIALGRSTAGPRGRGLMVKDGLQGAVYGVMCALALAALRPAAAPATGSAAVHVVAAAGFGLNFALVVTGLKLDWSFAMFSGLRPFGGSWLQRHGRPGWPRYYALSLPEKVPAEWLRMVQPQFLYRATRPEYAVHESVVFHLEAMARRSGSTLRPRLVVRDHHGRDAPLVPWDGPQPRPRRRVLLFPSLIPRSFRTHYLG